MKNVRKRTSPNTQQYTVPVEHATAEEKKHGVLVQSCKGNYLIIPDPNPKRGRLFPISGSPLIIHDMRAVLK